MRTAEEMLAYVKANGMGHDNIILRRAAKSFKIIEEHLLPNEIVHLAFLGNFKPKGEDSFGLCAFAMTDSKLIIAQKSIFMEHRIKEFSLRNINNIIERCYPIYGEIVFSIFQDTFSILQDRDETKNTYRAILTFLDGLEKKLYPK